jgi:selenocysteine lyase/cysteine desulfurase
MPKPGVDALARYWAEQSTEGVLSEPRYFPVIDQAREKMARLIGADVSEIAWTQNTSNSISMVANGLPWQPGDNVVTAYGEFPANVYPWLGLKRFGVETRLVQKRDGRVCIADVAAAIDNSTRLLSISFVDFATGISADLHALGELCRERGIFFNVDAIQGLGALQLDVHEANIHFLGAGAHKWMMGPQGLGMFYVRRDVLEDLFPITANWYAVRNRSDNLTYGQPWIESAARYEGSTPNVSGLVAFDAILDMIHEVGIEEIERRVLNLSGRLIEGLLSKGYDVIGSLKEGERSGVVCIRAKGDPMDILTRAQQQGIIVAVRVGIDRASPHFYNTEEEIDSFLALL